MSTATYSSCLAASQKVNWTIDEVLGGRHLDFGQDFLPESLAGSRSIDFLSEEEQRLHNQIRGHGYLATFGLVEEFILPFLEQHTEATLQLHGDAAADGERVAALTQFAEEEAKHIELFRRFCAQFEAGFGSPCACIGPPQAIADHVLSQHPLGVALMILHIEWMTLDHYVASVRDEGAIDPMFKDLLRYHWLEESQHARMDWLVVQELAASMSKDEIHAGFTAYCELLQFFNQGMRGQAELDLQSLKACTDREWIWAEEQWLVHQQHTALRKTFVRSGMKNRTFQQLIETLRPGSARELNALADAFECEMLAA